jgi:hypothetical protein
MCLQWQDWNADISILNEEFLLEPKKEGQHRHQN